MAYLLLNFQAETWWQGKPQKIIDLIGMPGLWIFRKAVKFGNRRVGRYDSILLLKPKGIRFRYRSSIHWKLWFGRKK